MSETKISVHRALSQAKTTKKRIEEILSSPQKYYFVSYKIGKTNTCNNISVEDAKKEMRANYDKINKLIENYFLLRQAIMKNNAGVTEDSVVKTVEFDGKDVSVADVILYQKTIIPYMAKMLFMLKENYTGTKSAVEQTNTVVDKQMKKQLETMFGTNKDSAFNSSEMESFINKYREMNQAVLVDPLNIKDKIDKLEERIEELTVAADSLLSEQNALSCISVSFEM